MMTWFSPRYMAFWLLILFAWLLCELWMPELRAHRALVSLVIFISSILILAGLR